VYLVPGLTQAQRNAALRRLRQESRMACGPRLPCVQLVLAIVADRIRTVFARAGAVIRLHPALTVLPTLMVAALAWLFVASMPMHPGTFSGPQGSGAVSSALSSRGAVSPEAVVPMIGTSIRDYLGGPPG
jgi:hypothetical protein